MTTVYAASNNEPIDIESLEGTSLIVTIPAAFSGTCTEQCVPGILSVITELRDAGVGRIIIVCSDQPFAINEWVRYSKWAKSNVEFASDFGSFQMRGLIGKLSDEEGKKTLPPCVGDLLRRSYTLYRDGKVLWQYREKDTVAYTLNVQEMLSAVAQ